VNSFIEDLAKLNSMLKEDGPHPLKNNYTNKKKSGKLYQIQIGM